MAKRNNLFPVKMSLKLDSSHNVAKQNIEQNVL